MILNETTYNESNCHDLNYCVKFMVNLNKEKIINPLWD